MTLGGRGPVVIVGDSFAAGVGASSKAASYPSLLAERLGVPVVVIAAGGSGFVTKPPKKFGVRIKGNHHRRVRKVPRNRSLLILQGSGNDRFHGPDVIADSMHRFLSKVRGESPVIATGAMWSGNRRHLLPNVDVAAKAVADQIGASYVDASQWFTEASAPALMAADGGHPNDAGHRVIAEHMGAALSALAS